MPPVADGVADPSSVPDYIAIAGPEGGTIGFARAKDVLGSADLDATIPVFGADLLTPVGFLVTGKGFVPLGVDPASVPYFQIRGSQSATPGSDVAGGSVVYVRNASAVPVWLQISGTTQGAQGFPTGVGVGCLSVGPGAVVVLDGPPQSPVSTVLGRLTSGPTTSREVWLDIDVDNSLARGTGVPDWWTGSRAC